MPIKKQLHISNHRRILNLLLVSARSAKSKTGPLYFALNKKCIFLLEIQEKKKLPTPHASVATPTSAKLMINITSSLRLKHLNIVSSSYRWSHAESCVKNKMRFHRNITIEVSPLHHTLRDGFMDLMNKTFCGRIYAL